MVKDSTNDDSKYKASIELYAAIAGVFNALTREVVPTKDELDASGWKLVRVNCRQIGGRVMLTGTIAPGSSTY